MLAGQDACLRITLGPTGPSLIGAPMARLGQVNLPEPLQTGKDVFAEWSWDGATIVVRNCRLGFFPVFYFATDTEFAVASSVEKLIGLGAPADLDDAALAVFLRLGWVLGEDTVFKAIRLVPPGGEVRWSGGTPQVTGGYAFPPSQHLSLQAVIGAHGELIQQAVRRRASPDVRFGFPLSGGRDSRHILLELNAAGCRPATCFTNHDFPPYREENIRVAKLLAQRLGLAHRALGQPGSRVATELKKNSLNHFGAMENAWCVSLYGAIARHGLSVVYEGSPGCTYFSSYVKKETVDLLERGGVEALSKHLLSTWVKWHGSEDALARLLPKGAAKRFSLDLAVDRLSQEIEAHLPAANPLASFYFWNRGRRLIGLQPFSIAPSTGVMAVTPYLDHDLVDLLASLPPDKGLTKAIHTETIVRLHPRFADIPYAGDSPTPLVESNWHYRRLLVETLLYLALPGSRQLVQRGPTIRRLLSLALSGGSLRKRMPWLAPFTAVYLSQLESLPSRRNAMQESPPPALRHT